MGKKCFSLILNKIIYVWKALWLFILNIVLALYKATAPGHSSLHPKLGKGGVVTLILQMQNTGTERRGDVYQTSTTNT